MIITVKTTLVSIHVEDKTIITNDGYTRRTLPDLGEAVKSVVEQAVALHNEVNKSEPK